MLARNLIITSSNRFISTALQRPFWIKTIAFIHSFIRVFDLICVAFVSKTLWGDFTCMFLWKQTRKNWFSAMKFVVVTSLKNPLQTTICFAYNTLMTLRIFRRSIQSSSINGGCFFNRCTRVAYRLVSFTQNSNKHNFSFYFIQPWRKVKKKV